jgi:S1-C subfamily serine protease
VLRDGKSHVLHVTAKAMPKDFASLRRKGGPADDDGKPSQTEAYDDTDLGIEVTDVTPDKAEALGLAGHDGVVITKVDSDKAAAEAGLKEGMLIMKVGQKLKSVKNVDEFKAAMKGESLKDGVVLLVRVRNGNRFVVVKQ